MNGTPRSNRLTVAVMGCRNAGKSALFNAMTGADNALVSDTPGTTADPVVVSMELLPHGPIVVMDTAGLDDDGGPLGRARAQKSESALGRADLVVYALDARTPGLEAYEAFARRMGERGLPVLPVVTRGDAVPENEVSSLVRRIPGSLAVSARRPREVDALKAELARRLDEIKKQSDVDLIGGLLPAGSVVVLVAPLDGEAPAGRLILPQVQLLRACLDNGLRCHVTTEKTLAEALGDLKRVDLVVTDSQVFGVVAGLVPETIPLTSFSILMSRQKGDLSLLAAGIGAVSALKAGDRVLIAETCAHARNHEDIGRVKIPRLLSTLAGPGVEIDFASGRDYPDNLKRYALIIHCGGCMISRKEMLNRLGAARAQGVPVTNYGLFLAHAHGVLKRSLALPGLTGMGIE